MNRQLRSTSIVALVMFLALFVSTSIISVFQVDNLRADSRNSRVLYESYATERGPILVNGQPIARSEPSEGTYPYQRVYTEPEQYSAVTGYYSLGQGTAGLEQAMNQQLTGTANDQFLDQLQSIFTGDEAQGSAVELTIDPAVQQVAWDALAGQGYEGAAVAIEPSTGRILAMVSTPGYDPNRLASQNREEVLNAYEELQADPDEPLQNRAIGGDLYTPGSVFKLIMTSAALENGYTPESTFANPPSLTLPGTSTDIYNVTRGRCGGEGQGEEVDLLTSLNLSCNIPFAQLAEQLGNDTIADEAEEYGFGQELSIPLSVTPSQFPREQSIDQTMLSSFGQSNVRMHALQGAMISAAVANGGELMTPSLVDAVLDPDDLTEQQAFSPEVFSTPMSPETSATLAEMMVDGVSNGAAYGARIDGVEVGGKTGTGETGGGPWNLWFSGFAPADDPQVAVAVVVGNGANVGDGQAYHGNDISAPIAGAIMEAVLNQ